jgi:hypothetical protein
MTKLFERAVETVRGLPPETQDALARLVLQLAREDDRSPMAMSVDDQASFAESMAEAERGDFVSDQTIQDFWARFVRVRYTPRAFRELQDIFAYIDDHSPLGGRNVKSRVHVIIELIASHRIRDGG